jgi:aminoglycoside phosphotransferase (APT) family kinase protein
MIRPACGRRDDALRSGLPAADAAWLAPVLEPDAVVETLRGLSGGSARPVACRVRHVRYRPGASCTVLYDVTCDDGDEAPAVVYARIHRPGRPEAPCASGGGGRLLDGAVRSPISGAVLREFPMDATMPEIGLLARPGEFARRVALLFARGNEKVAEDGASFVCLRYKPEHRLILRTEAQLVGAGGERTVACRVRFEHGADHDARADLVAALQQPLAAAGAPAAAPVGDLVPGLGCVVTPWVEGSDLSRRFHRGDTAVAHAAGVGLAGLARVEHAPVAGLPRRSPLEALAPARLQADAMQDHPPSGEIADVFASLVEWLEEAAPGPADGLVHGDFHQGQMLSSGDRTVLLDWDCVHRGDPATDYGRFLAQIHLLELSGRCGAGPLVRAFTEAHAAAGAPVPDADRVRFWTALALTDLALREVRRLRSRWHERALATAALAGRILEGGAAA